MITAETTREQMRDEYLSRVAALYELAKNWVEGFDPRSVVSEESIAVKEEAIEPYQAKVLVIDRPTYKPVRLIPQGRWIIGAEGRVDMKSDLGTETLVYESERDWSARSSNPPRRLTDMTENGKVLREATPRPDSGDVAERWVLLQNRQLRMFPSLDADLFHRLLEVLGR